MVFVLSVGFLVVVLGLSLEFMVLGLIFGLFFRVEFRINGLRVGFRVSCFIGTRGWLADWLAGLLPSLIACLLFCLLACLLFLILVDQTKKQKTIPTINMAPPPFLPSLPALLLKHDFFLMQLFN